MPYLWRQLTERQREELLAQRKRLGRPWHRPPHFDRGSIHYHLVAACYEHRPHIGFSAERMSAFSHELLESLPAEPAAWCVLPNHYHVLVVVGELQATVQKLSQLHGRTSFRWNQEEGCRGRKVWHGCSDRGMRGTRHFWATLNYIHQNPVRHGYARRWADWPFSSASDYLAEVGREDAVRIWREYPVKDYGAGWDDPEL